MATNIILPHITSIRDKYNNIAHTNFTTTFKVEPSYTKSTNIWSTITTPTIDTPNYVINTRIIPPNVASINVLSINAIPTSITSAVVTPNIQITMIIAF